MEQEDYHSILAADLFVILKAVSVVKDSWKKTAIFIDNISALSLISENNPKSYRHIVTAIQKNLLSMTANNIQFHWVCLFHCLFGHCQIGRKKIADKKANMGSQSDIHSTHSQTDISEYKS